MSSKKVYTCKNCGSEIKITIIAQRALVRDYLNCPICKGELSPSGLANALPNAQEMKELGF